MTLRPGCHSVGLIAAIFLISACGGSGGTTALPSRSGPLVATRDPTPALPPSLGTFVFVADLRTSSEVPPVVDIEASCTGQGRFVLRTKLDPGGKITSATAQFSFFVRSCPDSTQITQAHIHHGPANQNGVVRIDSGLQASAPTALRSGEIGLNVENVNVADFALVLDVIANPAAYYFNVHSALHPQGLVRGQMMHEP